MENIDNMAGKSLEALSRDNLTQNGKKKLLKEIICGAIALSCIVVGVIYSLLFPQSETVPAILYTIGFLIEGIPIFFAAIKGIITKNLTNAMEILVSIAIIACFFSKDLILAVIIPLILNIAHLLEERSIMGGRDVIDGLKRMQQTTAILYENGTEIIVEAKTLRVGQKILVKPGSGIPIDGIICDGEASIDQKSLTGESQPVYVSVGDFVYAGTVNIDGRIIIEVKKEYVDTSFSKILKLLEQSEGISIPESRLIDRFMKYYIPFVLAVAAAVALISADVNKAIAILVVSCPCGQMLVNSAPVIASLSVATKRGILIKNSKFLEELTEIESVIFDKTGTVTCGELVMTQVITFGNCEEETVLSVAASVASSSNHPVSRAVCNAVELRGYFYDKDYTVKEVSGKGMIGKSNSGHTIYFGNRQWLYDIGHEIPDYLMPNIIGSISYVIFDDKLLGCLCFSDTVRREAKDSILELRMLGAEQIVMLTGDREIAAKEICTQVGIDTLYYQLLPEDKLNHIRLIRESKRVLAVGDGINDALALREADVGIAMGAMGSDLAIQSADIALMNNNLMNIPFAIKLARKTKNIVYQNIVISILLSCLMITLSALGIISALAGSILHNLGAFAVLINSSRILKINE